MNETLTKPVEDISIRGKTILKDYIGQMRAAGFQDHMIKGKLLKEGRIFVPDEMPQNSGQTWATGMADEFKGASIDKTGKFAWGKIIPSINEYMEYSPNYSPGRVPTYQEYSNRNQPMGGFKGNQNTNLMNALRKRLEGYQGKTVGASNQAYEMGIVGLPQELANEWIPQFLQLAESKANEAREAEEHDDLQLRYPEIDVQSGDSADVIAQKIMEYNQNANYQKESKMPMIVSALDNAVYQAALAGENISIEDVMNTGMQLGFKLSYDEAMAIFTSAKKRALGETG